MTASICLFMSAYFFSCFFFLLDFQLWISAAQLLAWLNLLRCCLKTPKWRMRKVYHSLECLAPPFSFVVSPRHFLFSLPPDLPYISSEIMRSYLVSTSLPRNELILKTAVCFRQFQLDHRSIGMLMFSEISSSSSKASLLRSTSKNTGEQRPFIAYRTSSEQVLQPWTYTVFFNYLLSHGFEIYDACLLGKIWTAIYEEFRKISCTYVVVDLSGSRQRGDRGIRLWSPFFRQCDDYTTHFMSFGTLAPNLTSKISVLKKLTTRVIWNFKITMGDQKIQIWEFFQKSIHVSCECREDFKSGLKA